MNPYKSRRRARIVSIIIIIVMVISSLSFVAMLPLMGTEDSTAHGAELNSPSAQSGFGSSEPGSPVAQLKSHGAELNSPAAQSSFGSSEPGTPAAQSKSGSSEPGTSVAQSKSGSLAAASGRIADANLDIDGISRPGAEADSPDQSETDLINQAAQLLQMIEIVKANYKDQVTDQQLIDGAFNGVIDSLDDPFSVYYDSEQEKDNFMQEVAGEFGGVGISLIYKNKESIVDSVLPNTPADAAHIQSGDVITGVNGVSLADKSPSDTVNLLRGEPGTTLALTVQRDGKTLNFAMKREIIKSADVTHKLLDHQIGYIKLTGFGMNTAGEFKQSMLQLIKQGATSLIIDLRDNPGGFLDSAVDVADQLVPKGPIIYEEHQGKTVETIEASGQANTDIPIAVLVNGGSASASEALTGILQDTGRAVIIGTTTYGKGVAQQIMDLGDGKSIKLSTVYYLTPSKKKIDHVGITPDIVVQNIKPEDAEKLYDEYMSFAPMNEKAKPKKGDTGLNVYGAQQRLNLLGYQVPLNGIMDSNTEAAVKQFQKSQGYKPYGVLDYATMTVLDHAAKAHVVGRDGSDLQLQKAMEVLSKKQASQLKNAA